LQAVQPIETQPQIIGSPVIVMFNTMFTSEILNNQKNIDKA
jgi:hypothetical protein